MRRPLHILISDPHLRGGGQVRYVANLAAELTRVGHRVTIGCKRGSVLVEHAHAAACAVNNGFTFRGGLRPACWLTDLRETRRFILEDKPDILHVNGSQDHWAIAGANRLMGRPVCVVRTRHNTYPVHDLWPNRVLNRQWTDFQIVVCEMVRQSLEKQRAFDPARMCSIHNGVDAEDFRPDERQRAEARAEFGYRDSDLVCGIAARLVPAKGHVYLFRAAALLAHQFPTLRLLVLGRGDLEPDLVRLTRELGIADIARFAGFRDDMARCTQAFDLGVQPSIDCDTSSFSLKEQMAEEKPVICSDYGGLTEILSDGVEGFIVPTGSVEPLAEAMRKLLEDEGLRRTLGAAGRRRVLRDFTLQICARRTAEAYYRALEIHGAHSAS